MVLLRFRAWLKATKEMHEVDDIVSIDFEKKQICVKTLFFDQLNHYKGKVGREKTSVKRALYTALAMGL